MFLTSLRMRGFKSFADATALDVEPGVTVVVGPNGSGKSNVVDALAWVLGTTSAKKVRGGAMADVIFAGSPGRAPLGQARVEITIDNSDGQLGEAGLGTARSAQGFGEVRVARTIYASGDSLYEINGQEVRALDVQELLSDTGLGRELHTIVGQGQLDEILHARPEERRRYIEEAAGISKHRRRRERAARKLEQVEEHIDKLQTVLRELRRQLRPLERQAEAASKQRTLQAELRETRVRLLAHDLTLLRQRAEADRTADAEAADHHRAVQERLAQLRDDTENAESRLAALEPQAQQADATFHRLTSLRVRLDGTADLIDAKRRHLLEAVEEPLAGRPPDELRAQAARLESRAEALREQQREASSALDAAIGRRRDAEAARRSHEAAQQAERRRRAEQRERVLRWEGEISALRGSIASTEAEVGRVASHVQGLDARIAATQSEIDDVQEEIHRLDHQEVDLTASLEAAETAVAGQRRQVEELQRKQAESERARSSQQARADALRAALLDRRGGHAALLEASLDGVLGPVAALVKVAPEHDHAVAAALGHLGDAVAVATTAGASAAVTWLRDAGSGRAVVLPLDAELDDTASSPAQRPADGQPMSDLIEPVNDDAASVELVASLRAHLFHAFLVPDWRTAVACHRAAPQQSFVTLDGDVAGPRGYIGGQASERPAVSVAAAAEEAAAEIDRIDAELERYGAALTAASRDLGTAQATFDEALEVINESDARISGAAERLARLTKELHSLTDQRDIVVAQRAELSAVLERDRAALSELNTRGPEEAVPEDEGHDAVAERLDDEVQAAREAEFELRVRAERLSEQVRHHDAQADQLRDEADDVELALTEAAVRRERRRAAIARCGQLADAAQVAAEAVADALTTAARERDDLATGVREQRELLHDLHERIAAQSDEVTAAAEARHAAELRRADLERRVGQLEERATAEFGLEADEVLREHPDAAREDRSGLSEREDTLVRKLGLLGRVNPLALEEFEALERRHAFLAGQLDDLRRSKRDLAHIIEAVDDRIREVFGQAFADVAHHFERLFETMFPGGRGRLILTDPSDLLTTGVEVEARPPGKRVTRLSLLSGGERSLTVLAFVFAIFRARPSPFYVLDEVDAALDDVNLQRLLTVIEGFRGEAQIIMVTHQQRSMEVADVLYGVTMGPDAVTKVVAERLADVVETPTPPVDAAPARV